jgi:MFS family permease
MPRTRSGYGAAFASREFRALFVAQLVSVSGTSVAAVALTILVYRRTSSPLLASLTFALGFLPYVLGGGLMSAVVDRVRPRRLVVGCNSAASLLAAAMAWPSIPLPALFALLFAIGTLTSMSAGAAASLVRSSVSDDAYVPARSLMRIVAQLAQIGGNAAGGALLLVITARGALLVNAGSFVFAALAVRAVVADRAIDGRRAELPLLRDSLHGARKVLEIKELRRLLLVGWFAPMFAVAPEALAAPYVAHHHRSAGLVGWWLAALPVGLIAGDVAGVRWLDAAWQRALVAPVLIASFAPYLVFALDPSVNVSVTLLVVSGACGFNALGLDQRVRDAAPSALFARTMSLNSAGLMTFQGLGFALAGGIGQLVGAAPAIALAGVSGVTVVVVLLGRELLPRRRLTRADRSRSATPAVESRRGT